MSLSGQLTLERSTAEAFVLSVDSDIIARHARFETGRRCAGVFILMQLNRPSTDLFFGACRRQTPDCEDRYDGSIRKVDVACRRYLHVEGPRRSPLACSKVSVGKKICARLSDLLPTRFRRVSGAIRDTRSSGAVGGQNGAVVVKDGKHGA